MKGSGLLMLLGKKPKASGSDKGSEAGGDFLDEAFDAVRDDDRAGFKSAMREYVRSCMKKDEDDDDEDDGDHDYDD